MTANTDPATWHVLGDQITQSTVLKPGGAGLLDVFLVPYRIDTGPAVGHTGQVQIPADQYTADNVRAAVQLAVDATHGVAGLAG
jgi:hypothetical protein